MPETVRPGDNPRPANQDWVYDPGNGRIVARGDRTQTISYNDLVLGVSRMT